MLSISTTLTISDHYVIKLCNKTRGLYENKDRQKITTIKGFI